jgi:replicative DNA helicase
MPAALDEIEAISGNKAVGSFRIPTGIDDLDALLCGWSPGSLIVVGGRAGCGKTTFLLNACRAAAIKYRLPSLLMSSEMSARDLQLRIISAEARVSLHAMRGGYMQDEDWLRVARTMSAIVDVPLKIGAASRFHIEHVKTESTLASERAGLKLLAVDSLQSIARNTPYAARVDPIEDLLWEFKRLAEMLKVPIIVSAQSEQADSVGLGGGSLRDSAAIERISDVVVVINLLPMSDHPRAGEADFIVTKNRNGPLATVTAAFQGHYCRFVDMVPSDYPTFSSRAE